MTAHTASLLNGFILITVSIWAYYSTAFPSPTALIPTVVGAALLLCYSGVKAQNKLIAHIAVLLTLVVLIALIMPLSGAFGREDYGAVARVAIMMASSAYALFYFIKSFREARANKG